jgi:DNA-binding transcriptional ArsR family regulator
MSSQTLDGRSDAAELLSVLTDDRRRAALRVLVDSREEFTLTELAAAVRETRCENDSDGTDTAASLAVSLHHVHLPALAATGLVEYDRSERVVSATQRGRVGRDLVARIDDVSASLDHLATPDGGDLSPPSRYPASTR